MLLNTISLAAEAGQHRENAAQVIGEYVSKIHSLGVPQKLTYTYLGCLLSRTLISGLNKVFQYSSLEMNGKLGF